MIYDPVDVGGDLFGRGVVGRGSGPSLRTPLLLPHHRHQDASVSGDGVDERQLESNEGVRRRKSRS